MTGRQAGWMRRLAVAVVVALLALLVPILSDPSSAIMSAQDGDGGAGASARLFRPHRR